jgi:NAD+ diphosphatase
MAVKKRPARIKSPLAGLDVLVGADDKCLFEAAELPRERTEGIFIGTVDGRPCFVTELDDAASPLAFTSLRAAIMTLGTAVLGVVSTAVQVATWDDEHRFCSRCATPLTAAVGERAKACSTCNLHYYPRISPCVIVLVEDGDRVLLAHKPKMPFFALVAGFVEAGESLEEAVAREVAEETGVRVSDISYFGSQTWPFPHQIMIGFRAKYAGGDIQVDQTELDDVQWFKKDAMPPVPPPISIAGKLIEAWVASRP